MSVSVITGWSSGSFIMSFTDIIHNKDTHMHNVDGFIEGLEKIVYSRVSQLSHNIVIKEI